MTEIDLSWRTPALIRFDELMHAEGPHLTELRNAGVSERRIEALYPFDFENYRDGTLRLFSGSNQVRREAANLSMFDVYEKVAARLPTRLARQALGLHFRPHAEWTNSILTIRRVLFDNLFMLPLTLRLLGGYPFPKEDEPSWIWSHHTVRLKKDLPQFEITARGWLALIETNLG